MFRHSKISIDKTNTKNAREKPECSVKTKEGDQLGEQFRQHRQADHGAQEQDRGPSASYFSGEHFTHYKLQVIQKDVMGQRVTFVMGAYPS